jgi:hypothetical protein
MEGELSRASLFFRYIREENEHHKMLFERGKREMLESLRHVRPDPEAASKEAPQPTVRPDPKMPAAEDLDAAQKTSSDSDVKRLYRKIARETHPDKTDKMGLSQKESEKRSNAYKRATEAAASLDIDTLVEIAVDFEIDTGLDNLLIADSLRRRAKLLEDEISKIKSSVEWFWIHAADERKIEIIKEICKRNGWIYVTEDQITDAVRRALGVHPGSREEVMKRARESMQKRRQIS